MTELRGFSPASQSAMASQSTALAPELQSQVPKSRQTLDSVKLLTDLAQVVALLKTQSATGTPGMSNSAGAPAIGEVKSNFSPEDLAAALLVLQGKTQEAQRTMARDGLTISKTKLDEKNQQANEKINGWIKKSAEAISDEPKSDEAKGADIAGKMFGLLAKAAGFIASVAALTMAIIVTAVSSGAGTPLIALFSQRSGGPVGYRHRQRPGNRSAGRHHDCQVQPGVSR